MSDFVALEWERREWFGLDAESNRGRLRIRRGFRVARPDEADATDAEREGAWLRAEFDRLGIDARRVMVSLPREDVVVRQLEVPNVPDEELPDLVRLQAETKSSSSLDRQVLDFIPLPVSTDEAIRQVLLVTVPTERIERIRQTIVAAGGELVAVGISPLATAMVVAHVESQRNIDPFQTALIVARHGKRVEISVMRERRLLFTHATQLSGEDDARNDRLTVAEVRRSMGALSRIAADVPISRAWIVSTHADCDLLKQSLAYDVARLDPTIDTGIEFEKIDAEIDRACFSGPLGMLLGHESSSVETIDFLAPRRAVVPVDRRRLKAIVIAASVVVLLVAAWGYSRWQVHGLDVEAEELQSESNDVEKILTAGKPVLAAARTVEEWRRSRIDLPSELDDFAGRLPGTDRLFLEDFRFTPAAGDRIARIQAHGSAKSREDVEETQDRLADERAAVLPHEIRQDSKSADYRWRFQLDVTLAPEPMTPPKAKATTESPNMPR